MTPPTHPRLSSWQRALRALHRSRPASAAVREAVYEGVLGTSLHLHLSADRPEALPQAEAALFDEITRLERIFSRFDPGSELNRWLSGELERVPLASELGGLLEAALEWQRATQGAFNPASDALSTLWRGAERRGEVPNPTELAAVVEAIQLPTYRLTADGLHFVRASALPLNLNAFAKGYIVDRAAAAARQVPGLRAVLLNIGGDLRHLGEGALSVLIADPFSRADNVPPVDRLLIRGQAVATSGGSWRGFQLGGRWLSHLLDPRTGWPAERVAGVSVIADDAARADLLATALSILDPEAGLALVEGLPRVGALITTADHQTFSNAFWQAQRA